ncbi:MAG: hypoxanthine phosphoribosyltransferase [Clostridia bacterium]
MKNDIQEVLYSVEQIESITTKLGSLISADYIDRNPIIVSVLKGSFIFMADLVRKVSVPCEIDFMVVSSYGAGTSTSGEVQIIKDLATSIQGRDIILVEDILDSGVTLSYITSILEKRGARSIEICTFLNKPARRKANVHVKYNGFNIEDEFVVGYGLDYAEKYRNLPYVGILKPEIYSK